MAIRYLHELAAITAKEVIVKNPSNTIGFTHLGTVQNNSGNNYIRGSIIFSRNKNDITWSTADAEWTRGGGSSNDFSAILHTSASVRFLAGPALSTTTTYTNTEFLDAFEYMRANNNSGDVTFFNNVTFTGNVMPAAENAHNIGSASVRWEDLYVDDGYIRNAYIDEYVYHNGNTGTNIRFQTDRQTLTSGGGAIVDLHSNGSLYFTGDAIFYNTIKLAGSSNEIIKSDGSVRIDIDNNNDQTDRIFIVSKHNSATELFRVNESGNGIFTGSVYATDFVDADNTDYYVDPDWTSVMADIDLDGFISHNGYTSTKFGFSNNHEIKFITNSNEVLKLDSNQLATFSGDVTVNGGDITVNTTGKATLTLNGDSDNVGDSAVLDSEIKMLHDGGDYGILLQTQNHSGRSSFKIVEKITTTETMRFQIDESGDGAFSGNIILNGNDDYISFNTSGSGGNPKIKMNSDASFTFVNTAGSNTLSLDNSGNVSFLGTVTVGSAFTLPSSIGSAGQVLKVPSSGTTLEWGAGGGATVANDANNRITTAVGDGTLNAEANLTFDGSTLDVSGSLDVTGAISAGSSATNGGVLIRQNYSSPHYLGVISSHYSNGNLIIGNGAQGKVGSSGYVSTYGNFSGGHSALEVKRDEFLFKIDASDSQTTVGSDVTLADRLKINRSGTYVFGNSTSARLQVDGDVKVMGSTDLNIQGSNRRLNFTSGTGTVRTTTSNNLILETNNLTALTLDTSQNASFEGSISMNQSSTQVDMTGNSSGNFTIDNNTGNIAFQANGSTVNSMTITSSEITLNEDVRVGSFGNNNHEFAFGQTIADKVYNYGAEFQTLNSSIQIVLGRNDGTNVNGTGGIGADQNNAFAVWNTTSTTQLFEVEHDGDIQVAGAGTFTGDLMPSADSTYNIGIGATRWANIYADNFYGIVDKLSVTANDTFTGTYSLLWHSGNTVYSSSFMTINGSNDTLSVPNIETSGDITIGGNLTVTGTNTIVNVEDLNVEQNEITLNYGTGDTSATADGAGIRIQDAAGSSTDAVISWDYSDGEFDFSHPINVPGVDYKVATFGTDNHHHYKVTGNSDHTLTLTCGSYYQAEIIITAHQTNGGANNNLYIRGIWSNNHESHHWDEMESIGGLTNSTIDITVSANTTSNSGKLLIEHDYVSGSFAQMVVRVKEYYGTAHEYTIS